ncbi:hypothetical protein P8A22_23600 [Streptomyces laculatispora]|uniref:Uncharacterized protein n=1 Tax=Streptomyces laculatispora TaxID=887464 RepID=A0ABY9I708_9ACTN|nr:hypothetical protein [Streptomyces laculatispora]WLQ42662.1 hypothetical protein P8A22_23600 [Streptomyces laculatispora]
MPPSSRSPRSRSGATSLTAEPGKRKKEKHKVKAVIVTTTDREFVDVVVATNSGPKTIQTTEHHQPHESTEDAWTQVAYRKAGQKLQNDTGGPGAGTGNCSWSGRTSGAILICLMPLPAR